MKVISPQNIAFSSDIVLTRASTGTYIDANGDWQIASNDTPRINYRKTPDGSRILFDSVLVEPQRTNSFLNSYYTTVGGKIVPSVLATQTRAVPLLMKAAVVSFYGTGSITIIGTGVNKVLQGTSANTQVSYAFGVTPSTNIVFTVSGQVFAANLEFLTQSQIDNRENPNPGTDPDFFDRFIKPTSWIPTQGSAVTRAEEIIASTGIFSSFFATPSDYNSGTTYLAGNQVSYANKTYVSLVSANTGNQPDISPTKWKYLEVTAKTYNAATTYAIGARVVYSDRVYESLENSNTGNQPDISPTKWIFVQTSNKYAMLDLETGSVSKITGYGLFFLHLKNTYIDSVGMLEIDAANVDVSIIRYSNFGMHRDQRNYSDYRNTVSIVGTSLEGSTTLNRGTLVCFRIYPEEKSNPTTYDVTARLVDPTREVSIGELVVGNYSQLGTTEYGLTAGITDYSVKETNEFGTVSFVRRGFSKRISANIFLDNSDINYVLRNLYSLRAQPTLWVMTDDDQYSSAAVVFGYYRDFSLVIPYPTSSMCSIEIEGLVIN